MCPFKNRENGKIKVTGLVKASENYQLDKIWNHLEGPLGISTGDYFGPPPVVGTIPQARDPGLNRSGKSKLNTKCSFVHCSLTVGTKSLAPSDSYCCDFPVLMNCNLEL